MRSQIGLVATASLLGTALLTLAIGWIAPRFDLRALLLFGAGLMAATGIAFPNVEHLALIALVGVHRHHQSRRAAISACWCRWSMPCWRATSPTSERTHVFARYSLIGALCAAAGSLAASLPDFLVAAGSSQLGAFRVMFYAYAALGVICALLYRRLPHAHGGRAARQRAARPLARHRLQARRAVQPRCLCRRLCRAVAAGAVAVRAFRPVAVGGGLFFFWASDAVSAFSYPVAAWLAKRIGLINTMVFTHIPSSIFLILAAFSPNLYVALALLLLRSALSQMDVPTRTSYVMAVVTPAERPRPRASPPCRAASPPASARRLPACC